MRVVFETVGCGLSQSETDSLAGEIVARMAMLREVTQASSEAFRSALLGRSLPVLWERELHPTPEGPQWRGPAHDFQRVRYVPRDGLANRVRPTHLGALENGVFLGLPAAHRGQPSVYQG